MTKTDLFGRPLGAQPEPVLSLTQKRQATMLYHWMSLDYLRGLKAMIDALVDGAGVDLALARAQGRDQALVNDRWGVRDTAANWSTHVYPALNEFRQSTIKDIAARTVESYEFTGAYQCSRMISEHSSLWMTPEEETRFKAEFEKVYRYASRIDHAAGAGGARHQLDDLVMTLRWDSEFAHSYARLPRYRVRTDVVAESGSLPPRTGVYVSQDDPNGTLQFAWTGNADGRLGQASTFNSLGLEALAKVGRDRLWRDPMAMVRFVEPLFKSGRLNDRDGFPVGTESQPDNAMYLIAEKVFESRPCKWHFVERIDGEFEDEAAHEPLAPEQGAILRCESGQPCPRKGYWFTPARPDSRRGFEQGEVMPATGGDYGTTIWQWDEQQ